MSSSFSPSALHVGALLAVLSALRATCGPPFIALAVVQSMSDQPRRRSWLAHSHRLLRLASDRPSPGRKRGPEQMRDGFFPSRSSRLARAQSRPLHSQAHRLADFMCVSSVRSQLRVRWPTSSRRRSTRRKSSPRRRGGSSKHARAKRRGHRNVPQPMWSRCASHSGRSAEVVGEGCDHSRAVQSIARANWSAMERCAHARSRQASPDGRRQAEVVSSGGGVLTWRSEAESPPTVFCDQQSTERRPVSRPNEWLRAWLVTPGCNLLRRWFVGCPRIARA